MKKWLMCFLLIVLSLSLCGCSQAEVVEVNHLIADRITLANSPENLQEISDLIVVICPQNQENILTYYSDGNVSVGYTKTTGIVTEVLSGAAAEGDEIIITEECYTTNSGSKLWTQQGYLPMKISESYLLFLKAYSAESEYAGMYFPIDLEYGKYALTGASPVAASTSYNAEQFEVDTATDLSKYVEWYQAVSVLYPDVFN